MGLIHYQVLNQHTELGIWHIEESFDELYKKLILDEQERRHLESLIHPERTRHWLASRVLLRHLLKYDGFIDCKADAYNKPYLRNLPYHISLSHAKDYAAAMISNDCPVGVDVEVMEEKILKLARRFLSNEELEFIDERQKIEHLYACWGAKEALYKLYGKGGLPFIGGIMLDPFPIERRGTITGKINKADYPGTLPVHYEVFKSYMLVYTSGLPLSL